MTKLLKYISDLIGTPLSSSIKKEMALLHPDYDSVVVPTGCGEVEEYIDEMVELNDWTEEDKAFLTDKVKQYQIITLGNDRLYIEVLKFISTKK